MIALDTNALSLLFIKGSAVYKRGSTIPIKHGKERIEELVERIAKSGGAVVIPAPVLSELLVKVPPKDIANLLAELNGSMWYRLEPFDTASAIELADRTAKAIAAGDKKEGLIDPTWAKIKFDRQILCIAIVSGATELISNDPHLVSLGERWGFPVTDVGDLPLPQALIPPPLLAQLEQADEEDTQAQPPPTNVLTAKDQGPRGPATGA